MKNKMLIYHDLNKRDNTDSSRIAYCNTRDVYKHAVNVAKKQYTVTHYKLSSQITRTCKSAWEIIGYVQKSNHNYIVCINPDDSNIFLVKSVEIVNMVIVQPNITTIQFIEKITTVKHSLVLGEVAPKLIYDTVHNFKTLNSEKMYRLSSNLVKSHKL